MEKLISLAETTSTNDEIKRAIDAGEAEGRSVMALKQTAGYGRQGRTWESPVGGLYQSFLMRPEVSATQLPTLSLVMGMAVCNTVRSLLPESRKGHIMVKWPNDVVLVENTRSGGFNGGIESACSDYQLAQGSMGAALGPNGMTEPVQAEYYSAPRGMACRPYGEAIQSGAPSHSFKKIAGISLECYKGAVCVGIGINVAQPEGAADGVLSEDAKNKAVYLDDLGLWAGSIEGRVKQVSRVLTQKVWALYGQWLRIGFGEFAQSFNMHYNALAGQFVSMVDINDRPLVSGRVECVDGRGELVLLDAQGYERSIASGEAHII